MPADFLKCVADGGRVRTKSMSDGKYMRMCFIGGKSYAGEVKTKEELSPEDLKDIYTEEVKNMTNFNESLTFSFKESKIDEESRTVRVCALAPCISKNNRFYSPKVVESVSGTLTGKKSFADHDDRDTKNLIGRIVKEEYVGGKLYADIKISKASGIAKQTWEKIQDGTITDVSIAADGKSKKIKLGEQLVDEVTDLKIMSVDFVTEGGIQDAKVMQVYEDIKTIPQISEVNEEMTEQEIKENMESCMKAMKAKGKSEEMASKSCKMMVDKGMKGSEQDFSTLVDVFGESYTKEIADLKIAKETAEFKLVEKEIAEFKESEIVKLESSDKVKDILRKRVSGKSKEEILAKLTEEVELIKQFSEALKENKVDGIPPKKEDNKEKKETFNSEFIRKSTVIPENLKGKTIEILWEEGEVKSKEFLKQNKIEV